MTAHDEKPSEHTVALVKALRKCIDAMENYTIEGDGRLDRATAREFWDACSAAEIAILRAEGEDEF